MENQRFERREYLEALKRKRGNGLIKIITGMRRVGKSYLLDPLFTDYLREEGVREDQIIRLRLDARKNEIYHNPDALEKYLDAAVRSEKKQYYFILDEIQLTEGFESVLNEFLYRKNVDIYVTGSNSKFLSSDIVTEFRGRGDEIRVYPLAFSEIMAERRPNDRQRAWEEYLVYGGMPLAVLAQADMDKRKYLTDLARNAYVNDVIERNNLQDEEGFNVLLEIVASAVGSLTNPSKLARAFASNSKIQLDRKTIFNYLQAMEDAFIIEKSRRYDVKGKHYIDTPYKYYFTDVGVRNSLINFRQIEENHIMENVIYNELRRRGYAVDVGVVEARGKKGRVQTEVDFVCNLADKRLYIQSALNVDDPQKLAQEKRPLEAIDDSFEKIIITKSGLYHNYDEKGILMTNVIDWLLMI